MLTILFVMKKNKYLTLKKYMLRYANNPFCELEYKDLKMRIYT